MEFMEAPMDIEVGLVDAIFSCSIAPNQHFNRTVTTQKSFRLQDRSCSITPNQHFERAVAEDYKSKVISFARQTHVPLHRIRVSIVVSFAPMKHVPLH
jgi:hypothetical protein